MATNDVDTPADFTYLWAIENFLALFAPESIKSPVFEVESLRSTSWHLAINEKDEKFLSVGIYREQDSGPSIIEVDFQLSLLTSKGTFVKKENHRSQFIKGGHFEIAEPTEYFKSEMNEYVMKDTLTLRCQMWVVGLDTPRPNLCFAGTRLGFERRTFFCNLRNFSTLSPGQVLKYHVITTAGDNRTLTIAFCVMESGGKEEIIIKFSEESNKLLRFNCEISVLDALGRKCMPKSGHNLITSSDIYMYFLQKNEVIDKNPSLLLNDVMCLRCELEIGYGAIWNDVEFYLYQPS
ncbi:TD and POZ domain-containing protein 4 [Trichonephila inaurata madagascariensis]|uniref:TD and POZ domain-containing protein 4 n=1 Tax=Trichonephila inaurata madagascariensis TaxID=2747483 RepID=A0A8X6YZD5_9ARAC|nr:TD and POZ domain-containing protein 4 [Trichonephila inaurata madagascariensis]GFY80102.1 TD and POZ domain-containing protein 4 [Trichonephila inaurata madagascariensis]